MAPGDVTVTRPDSDAVADLADLWVGLATEQREHESHLQADDNRPAIREMLVRHVVTDRALVAVADERIVGFVTFDVESDVFRRDVDRGIVEHLYVVPDRRGEGIGGRLLEAAEDALADRGVDVVTLESMATNDGARRFYRRRGYDVHRVTMEKSLDGDAGEKSLDGDAGEKR